MPLDDSPISVVDAIRDERLIGDEISEQQEVMLRAAYGLPLQERRIKTRVFIGRRMSSVGRFETIDETPEQFFCRITSKPAYVPTHYRECGIYIGARGGKSDKLSANVTLFEACFRTHKLSRGEKGLIPCVAFDKKQASIVFNYIKGKASVSPAISKSIVAERAGELELINGLEIGVYTCSFRALRGYSIPAAVADEIAIWRDVATGANPAKEVLRTIRRGMMTFPEAKLIKISSPFAKTGVVWDDWNNRLKRQAALILKVPAWEVNPALNEEELLEELKDDPELFWREFGAEFWDAVSPLCPAEKVDACVMVGVKERAYRKEYRYFATIDVAFRQDAFAFGVCHREGDRVVWDVIRSWEGTKDNAVQLDPTLDEIAGTCRNYLISTVNGDQYCSEPVKQALLKKGLQFNEFTFTQNSKQQLYANLRSLIMGGCLDLIDNGTAGQQIKTLEAVTGSMGTVRVQAASGYKDDEATVVAEGSYIAMQGSRGAESWAQSFKERAASNKASSNEAPEGRTICVDCGRLIDLGEPYHGVGPVGMGQCLVCSKDHGAPNWAHVKPGPKNIPKPTLMSEEEASGKPN